MSLFLAKHSALAKSSPAPPSPPTLPPRPAPPPKMTKAQQRAKVIDELIITERDFHHQMEICSSKILPALREVSMYAVGKIVSGTTKSYKKNHGGSSALKSVIYKYLTTYKCHIGII